MIKNSHHHQPIWINSLSTSLSADHETQSSNQPVNNHPSITKSTFTIINHQNYPISNIINHQQSIINNLPSWINHQSSDSHYWNLNINHQHPSTTMASPGPTMAAPGGPKLGSLSLSFSASAALRRFLPLPSPREVTDESKLINYYDYDCWLWLIIMMLKRIQELDRNMTWFTVKI